MNQQAKQMIDRAIQGLIQIRDNPECWELLSKVSSETDDSGYPIVAEKFPGIKCSDFDCLDIVSEAFFGHDPKSRKANFAYMCGEEDDDFDSYVRCPSE